MQRDIRSFWGKLPVSPAQSSSTSGTGDDEEFVKRKRKHASTGEQKNAEKEEHGTSNESGNREAKRQRTTQPAEKCRQSKTNKTKTESKNSQEGDESPKLVSSKTKSRTPGKSKETRKRKVESTEEFIHTDTSSKKEHQQTNAEEPEESHQEPAKKKPNFAFWNRSTAAINHGCKAIPEGKPNCLADCVLCVTGILESLDRDEVYELVDKYGGISVKSLTKKITHLLVGNEPGGKVQEAEKRGIKIISEDDFLKMIAELPAKPAPAKKRTTKTPKAKEAEIPQPEVPLSVPTVKQESCTAEDEHNKQNTPKSSTENHSTTNAVKEEHQSTEKQPTQHTDSQPNQGKTSAGRAFVPATTPSLLLVDNFKPQKISQIVGNLTTVTKLKDFLRNWGKKQDGPKAALLSGPPGIGKTTMAHVISNELGFRVLEFNASDCRNKGTIKEKISEVTRSYTLAHLKTAPQRSAESVVDLSKSVLVMDEVDGMSSGDRGGFNELVQTIKGTRIPVICICNNRDFVKVRDVFLDLRMCKPTPETLATHLMKIAEAAHQQLPREVATTIAQTADGDIRQSISSLQLWLTNQASGKPNVFKKDATLTPYTAFMRLFVSRITLEEQIRCYFVDPSMVPLLVQDNYPRILNRSSTSTHLQRLAATADMLSAADTVETAMRRNNMWGLYEHHALLSTVLPIVEMKGQPSSSFSKFPSFLGKTSHGNKMTNVCKEVQIAMSTTTTMSREQLARDAFPLLKHRLVDPLKNVQDLLKPEKGNPEIKQRNEEIKASNQEYFDQVIAFMDTYHISAEDRKNIISLAQFKENEREVSTYASTALTKEYNARHTLISRSKAIQLGIEQQGSRAAGSANDDPITSTNDGNDGTEERGAETEDGSDAGDNEDGVGDISNLLIKRPKVGKQTSSKPKSRQKRASKK